MSIRDIRSRTDMQYKMQRNTCLSAMAENKRSMFVKEEAFKYFASGLVNLEIVELLCLPYAQVIQLRIAYESRCQK